MRRLALVLLVSGLAGAGAQAQPAGSAEIEAVIKDQFADFQAGNLKGAFDDASPLIRSMFGSPENFGRMVQSGYPAIWAARDLRFLGLHDEGGRLLQRLMVRDAAGAAQLFDYEMKLIDGQWRINGVFPLAGDSVGA